MTEKKKNEQQGSVVPPEHAKTLDLGVSSETVDKEPEQKPVFKEEDLVLEGSRILVKAMERCRRNKFKKTGFTYQELEFLLKIVNLTNTKVTQMNQVLNVYSERDTKLRQKLLEMAELVQLRITLV